MESHKLATGPFTITKIILPESVQLELPCIMRIHMEIHFSRLKPVGKSPLVHPNPCPLLPQLIDDGPV